MRLACILISLCSYCWVLRVSFYILDNSPLLDRSYNFFLQICGLSPYSLVISFCRVQKFKISMNFTLPIISFIVWSFSYPKSYSISLMLSSHFIVLNFIFRVYDSFWVKFCEEWKLCLDSFFCRWMSDFFSTICWKDYLAPLYCLCMVFAPLSNTSSLYLCGSTSGLSNLLHWLICLFFCQYHTVLIILSLKVGYCHLPILIFSFNILLATLGPLLSK